MEVVIYKSNEENNFVEFVISFQKYLNINDFGITSSDIEDFFKCINLFNIKIGDKKSLSDISMPIFCKNPVQKIKYAELFNKFYDKRIEFAVSDLILNKFKGASSEAREFKNEKEKLLALKRGGQYLENKENLFSYAASDSLLDIVDDKETKDLLEKLKTSSLDKTGAKELNKKLKDILNNSLQSKDFNLVADELLEIKNVLDRFVNLKSLMTLDDLDAKISEYDKLESDVKRKLEEGLINLVNYKDIYKEKSLIHRTEWTKTHGTVKSDSVGEINLDKSFKSLSSKERELVKNYIKSQAIKFRTRASRDIRSKSKSKIDFKETMKKATETGGIPLRIAYEKPKLNKSKIVMFLDISGSCKDASELMIHFMYTIKEVFQGGVKCYVFVNQLYDISDYLNYPSADQSIQKVFEIIPKAGVYSDYYKPFKRFVDENLYEITKDTIVYFIGDARNNKNPVGDENIKTISRKAKKSFWLNTEDYESWGTGDSIIYQYMPYMNSTFEVLSTSDLLFSIEKMF